MEKIKIGYRWLLCLCLLFASQTQAQTTYSAPNTMSVEDAYQLGDLLVDQYKIKQGQPYLKYAAEHGNATAQHELARYYEVGKGWFFIPGRREKEVNRLYKASAEQGNLRGMEGYASIISDEGNKKEALDIWIKMANTGDAVSISVLAARYLHAVPQITYPEKDEVLGAAYSKIYLDSMGTDKKQSLYEIYKENYLEAMSHLSEAQKEQVNEFAKEFLKTHTVRVLY
ncbi:TPA: hypothetical protein ACX6RO_001408 [Photobacterium damselae]